MAKVFWHNIYIYHSCSGIQYCLGQRFIFEAEFSNLNAIHLDFVVYIFTKYKQTNILLFINFLN